MRDQCFVTYLYFVGGVATAACEENVNKNKTWLK